MLSKVTAPGFERYFSLRLEKFIRALPTDAVNLQVKSQADFVAFKILPTNQKSAGIEGEASTQGGIAFKIGRETVVELSTREAERFFQICEAIFASRFTESLVYSSKGRVLYSRIRLEIKGRNVRLGGRQLFWRFFPNKRNELFQYEPYF